MNEHIETIVIGAGQSGLSISYYLTQHQREHILLEKNQVGESWRSGKWDSFTLVSPNWTIHLPGFHYSGNHPDDYLTREEVIQYLEDYVRIFNPPIRSGVEVSGIKQQEGSGGFIVETQKSKFFTDNVVIAAGAFQKPRLPEFANNISAEYTQLHTSQYRNPKALPTGAVLVVGSGQSGCQIAEELNASGRKVYLSTGSAVRIPRRYRGKDIFWWVNEMGMFDETADELDSPDLRFAANPQLTGKDGGHALNLHQFALDGIHLMGRMKSASGHQAFFVDDLHENLKKADEMEASFIKGAEKFIAKTGLNLPEDGEAGKNLRAGFDLPIVTELDLKKKGITTIIWATGYGYDYSWIDFPVFDSHGYPIHKRGVTQHPGLYFIGLQYLYTSKSSLLLGVGDDASFITEQIVQKKDNNVRHTLPEKVFTHFNPENLI